MHTYLILLFSTTSIFKKKKKFFLIYLIRKRVDIYFSLSSKKLDCYSIVLYRLVFFHCIYV